MSKPTLAATLLLMITPALNYAAEGVAESRIPPLKITINGRPDHPSVYVTKADFARARDRAAKHPWAKKAADALLKEADKWTAYSEQQIIAMIPGEAACYAYGFTGCPVCGSKLPGLWGAAGTASLDDPNHVKCVNGHRLPDDAHPDTGKGYVDAKGKKFYFVGSYNAFVIDTLTLTALDRLTLAYGFTGDAKYAERAALILDHLARIYPSSTAGSWDYPSDPPSGRFNRPWYQVARMLIHYADHYDILLMGDALDKPSSVTGLTRRKNVEDNLLLNGANYCYQQAKVGGALHNGQADYQRGQMAVAAAMGIPEYMAFAVESPAGFRNMVENNLDRDGQYYETSSGYSHHARYLYMNMAEILQNYTDAAHPRGYGIADLAKFRAAFVLPRHRLDAAGFLPNFGDDGPNATRLSGNDSKAVLSDLNELEHLAALTGDDSYKPLLAARAKGNLDDYRAKSGYADWLLFHAVDADGDSKSQISNSKSAEPQPSDLIPQRGFALLRAGAGDAARAVTLRAGPTLNHGHYDELQLSVFGCGYDLTYDLGYGLASTHTQVGWAKQTAAHNLVVVDETTQLEASPSGGTVHQFVSLPGLSLVRADDPACYTAQKVTRYDRTVALVDVGADSSYAVDLFRVAGGKQHDYMFHAHGTKLSAQEVELSEPAKGSLAGEDVKWGENLGSDGDVPSVPNKPYWNPPPGNGYGFIMHPRKGAAPTAPFSVTWDVADDAHLRLTMLPFADGGEVFTAWAPGIYPHLPKASLLVARNKQRQGGSGPLSTTYAAVIEPYAKSPAVKSVTSLKGSDPTAVGIRVALPNDRVDYVLHTDAPATWAHGSLNLKLDGGTAVISTTGGAVTTVTTVGAAAVQVDKLAIRAEKNAYTAKLTKVDADKSILYTDAELPTGPELAGQYLTVGRDTYSHRASYKIDRVTRDGDVTAIHLAPTSLVLGRGHVAGEPKGDVLPNVVPHEFARSRSTKPTGSGFFRGKLVASKDGSARTTIKDMTDKSAATMTVADTTGFKDGDDLLIYDAQPGDDIHIPTVLHLKKTGSTWSTAGSNATPKVDGE